MILTGENVIIMIECMKKKKCKIGLYFKVPPENFPVKEDDVSKWSHKHDYPIEEVWNTDNIIAQLIVPRLKAFRDYNNKHGVPPRINSIAEWNKIIDKMIYAFELNMYAPGPTTNQEKEDFQDGFALFCKYYLYLWD